MRLENHKYSGVRAAFAALIVTVIFAFFSSGSAAAELDSKSPKRFVQDLIEQARKTVRTRKSEVSRSVLRREIEELMNPAFDFSEMSRRSLGTHWKLATLAQQKQYTDLFSRLLSRTFFEDVLDRIEYSEVSYKGERIKGKKARVKTEIFDKKKDKEFPLEFRLLKNGNSWKVYEIVVESIGLVTNYRTEFSGIVRKEKLEGLIVRLQEKVAKLDATQ